VGRWLYSVDAVVKAANATKNQQQMPTPIWWTRRASMQSFRVGEFINKAAEFSIAGSRSLLSVQFKPEIHL
jgi:hypothetical protein